MCWGKARSDHKDKPSAEKVKDGKRGRGAREVEMSGYGHI